MRNLGSDGGYKSASSPRSTLEGSSAAPGRAIWPFGAMTSASGGSGCNPEHLRSSFGSYHCPGELLPRIIRPRAHAHAAVSKALNAYATYSVRAPAFPHQTNAWNPGLMRFHTGCRCCGKATYTASMRTCSATTWNAQMCAPGTTVARARR